MLVRIHGAAHLSGINTLIVEPTGIATITQKSDRKIIKTKAKNVQAKVSLLVSACSV